MIGLPLYLVHAAVGGSESGGTGDHKIYEAADQVGYSLAANFTRDFIKQFGISPQSMRTPNNSVMFR